MTRPTVRFETRCRTRVCVQEMRTAHTLKAITSAITSSQIANPSRLWWLLPRVMSLRLAARPVRATRAMWPMKKTTKESMTRKWIERAIWRLPNRRGYQRKRLSRAGDMARPVRIASGARMKMTEK